jgi:long-chain acyl-CoA synthetase
MIAEAELRKGASMEARSLIALFEKRAALSATRTCAKVKRGGRWQDVSWSELAGRTRAVADGLAAWGVKKGDRIAVIGATSLEWIIADVGVMGAAATVVPIYQSNTPAECQYIMENSGASWVFCDSEAQVAKFRQVRSQLPALKGVIRFSPEGPEAGRSADGWERSMSELERDGREWRAANEGAHEQRVAGMGPDDAACFIYTSGTTGNPKGVVLTHRNWTYTGETVGQVRLLHEVDLILLFLPMAHSFAMLIQACWFHDGFAMAFAESIEKLIDNAGEVGPTVLPAAPRIFEKAFSAVVTKGLATPGLKGKLFKMAMDAFDEYAQAKEQGKHYASLQFALANKLVFPKLAKALSERFGGRMRIFVSGSAPLAPKIAYFFELLGFTILEGYGLTETAACTTVNRVERNKIGTVGPPFPGTELRIAPDGEILIKSPAVMRGYHNNPEATAEAIQNGWFHTGDIGVLDSDGHLKITDRKKDIIVTSGGKNVAPQNLEGDLKTDPLISQVMVHGDKRKFLSALITLNPDHVARWAEENGLGKRSIAELAKEGALKARLQHTFDALNAKLPSYSTIKKFTILPNELSIEAGELTATMKVKRKFCTEKYRDVLDAFYNE